jgi:sRNA-binding regulator protein Hfq
MNSFNKARLSRGKSAGGRGGRPEFNNPAEQGSTGSEAAYLKSCVDSRAVVTVVLKTGERLRGRIRYYDRDCLSLGPANRGPNIFLRKSSILYICEH